jgi:hypothetical protein
MAEDLYEDTCEQHPTGCSVVIVAPGVEFHEKPAYKRAANPGALEAEAFDDEIALAEAHLIDLRTKRKKAHDDAYATGHQFGGHN